MKCDTAKTSVEIPPLLWRELTNDGLGKGQRFSWSYGCATNKQMRAERSWQVFEPNPASIASVELPFFNYKGNGTIKSTGTTNRTLIAVSKIFPYQRIAMPGTVLGEPDESALKFAYTYELPDGRKSTIVDGNGTVSSESLAVDVNDGLLPFQIEYMDDANEGFNDPSYGAQRRAAMEYAVAKWGQKLFGTVPVVIHASIDPLGANILGQCGPAAWGTSDPGDTEFDHVNTEYVSALANQLLGTDFWPTKADIDVAFSSTYIDQFYFGTDGIPGAPYDFVTIVLHELAHGLGFIDGLLSDGSYWTGNPFVFDHSLYYSGSKVVNLSQSQRASAIVSQALYWDGDNAKAANGGARVELYAPSTYSGGSSVAHWDNSVLFSAVMKWQYHYPYHMTDSRLLGAMRDMEWEFGYTYDAWVLAENIPEGQRGALDDPAGDGIENIWKFAAGLDPMTWYAHSVLYTYALDPVEDKFFITFKTAKFRPEATVVSAWTDNLVYTGWNTNGITTERIGETAEQESWKSSIPIGGQGFIRLRAELK